MQVAEFNRVLKEFAQKHAPQQVAVMERKIALEGLRRLAMKTPVDTGRARGGWQVGLGSYPQGQVDRLDPGGETTIAAGSEVIGQIKTPVRCVIANNVEYIEALEHGHSQQAPNGMLSLTLDELGRVFK